MSQRPKLTPLSVLMPVKGQATQPEQVGERASKPASEHVAELPRERPMSPAIQGFNQQTAADSPPEVNEPAHPQASSPVSERANKQAGMPAREPSVALADLDDPAEYIDGPRSSVSFRMTERLKDRLREYAHHSRRQKQDIMDQATHEFLRRQGF